MDYKEKYIYDYGFGDKVYFCPSCGSYHLIPKHLGGMQSHDWVCEDCHNQCSFTAAKNERIKEKVETIDNPCPTPEPHEFAAQFELTMRYCAFIGGTWEQQMN